MNGIQESQPKQRASGAIDNHAELPTTKRSSLPGAVENLAGSLIQVASESVTTPPLLARRPDADADNVPSRPTSRSEPKADADDVPSRPVRRLGTTTIHRSVNITPNHDDSLESSPSEFIPLPAELSGSANLNRALLEYRSMFMTNSQGVVLPEFKNNCSCRATMLANQIATTEGVSFVGIAFLKDSITNQAHVVPALRASDNNIYFADSGGFHSLDHYDGLYDGFEWREKPQHYRFTAYHSVKLLDIKQFSTTFVKLPALPQPTDRAILQAYIGAKHFQNGLSNLSEKLNEKTISISEYQASATQFIKGSSTVFLQKLERASNGALNDYYKEIVLSKQAQKDSPENKS